MGHIVFDIFKCFSAFFSFLFLLFIAYKNWCKNRVSLFWLIFRSFIINNSLILVGGRSRLASEQEHGHLIPARLVRTLGMISGSLHKGLIANN